ncbi:MAG: hypothetical protein WA130_10120 [Candidatus Methanoperedens sp.]
MTNCYAAETYQKADQAARPVNRLQGTPDDAWYNIVFNTTILASAKLNL